MALGVSAAATGIGMAMMDRQARPAALGFRLSGCFVKDQAALIEKDVILCGCVAQRTIVKRRKMGFIITAHIMDNNTIRVNQ